MIYSHPDELAISRRSLSGRNPVDPEPTIAPPNCLYTWAKITEIGANKKSTCSRKGWMPPCASCVNVIPLVQVDDIARME